MGSPIISLAGSLQGGGINLQGGNVAPQSTAPASILNNGSAHIIVPGPAPHPTASAPAPVASAGGSSRTSSGNGAPPASTFNRPQYLAGIQQEYGGQITANQRQAAANDAFFHTNNNLVDAQAGANRNTINQQAGDSMNTLDTQAGTVGSQQTLSLSELADQIHGQNQALSNELGTVGAGDSSAVLTGQNALAKVQNTGRADINETAGGQIANINAEKQAVTDQQKTQLDALDVWREQQLTQIMQLYQQNQNSIDGAMQTAEGEEKARLAEFGVALTQGVSASLQALDQQVQQGVTNITNYQVGHAPSIKAPVATPTPAAITAPVVSPFNAGNQGTPNNATAAPVGGSFYTLQQNNHQPAVA